MRWQGESSTLVTCSLQRHCQDHRCQPSDDGEGEQGAVARNREQDHLRYPVESARRTRRHRHRSADLRSRRCRGRLLLRVAECDPVRIPKPVVPRQVEKASSFTVSAYVGVPAAHLPPVAPANVLSGGIGGRQVEHPPIQPLRVSIDHHGDPLLQPAHSESCPVSNFSESTFAIRIYGAITTAPKNTQER